MSGRDTSSCTGRGRVAAWQARADPGGISHSPTTLRGALIRTTRRMWRLLQGIGAEQVFDVAMIEAINL